jgi:hypothetical protein
MMQVADTAGKAPRPTRGVYGAEQENSPKTEEKASSTAFSSRSAAPAVVAPAPAPAPATRIRRRNRMITSCLECRRRKLKCDKSHPCTNCIKASRDCLFLAPALDSVSLLKLTEIKEKMGSLERVLEQDVAKRSQMTTMEEGEELNIAPEPEDEKDLVLTPLALGDNSYDENADDDLTDLGFVMGKLRLSERIGGFFRPKMADEVRTPGAGVMVEADC